MAKKRKKHIKKSRKKEIKKSKRKLIKKPIIKKLHLKRKNININANILLNKWIWISLGAAFLVSVAMFITFFMLKNKGQITLTYTVLTIIALIPFVIFILYWGAIAIAFRLIFKAITKDIERDAVFPIVTSFLIQEPEISVKKYMEKGNLNKIKRYKTAASKLLLYTIIIVVLFIVFNFIFVGLTQLNVIAVSTSWLYLFGLLSNVISLVLSAVFGFMVSNIINAPAKFEEKYQGIKTKLYNFKVFLNVNEIKKVDSQKLKYRFIDFLPLYFYQSLLISEIKEEQYIQELENWKYYLTLSSYLNQFSWLLFLHYAINKDEQLKLIKKSKYMTKLANQIQKVHKILFHTTNEYIYFNNDYNAKELETEYNQLINIVIRYQNRFALRMITASLQKNGLKIAETISENKDENIIDERDVDINFFQLNYLEYLFSIIFTTDKDAKSKEHFKY
ncbi:hypothetical protein [Spiroplasma platyhelix]|uniref:Transmembrane protein n=1 Tax=Spiroplasma platyhelix PALS-1 TaxID=1276218 RepID=A0A846TQ24_9MOLU|nr:hypothetical protein [Spiroplasma platyhelix]MBE4704029.1 hypothetical protein [Spiroplasma platyhelix PALS-1]NKE38400.1 hypothetical protein [Spiroplasma platyhelix PALS-1]UJB29287.1 hypothetical protein SPLAT_v1c05230 [Spiroplasma platyhelix PALS-1]